MPGRSPAFNTFYAKALHITQLAQRLVNVCWQAIPTLANASIFEVSRRRQSGTQGISEANWFPVTYSEVNLLIL
jgi:hypothetical protein